MTKKQFTDTLKNYYNLEVAITKLEENLKGLDEKCGLQAVRYDKSRVQNSYVDIMAKIITEKAELAAKITYNREQLKLADDILAALPPIERRVIELKYKDGVGYWAIARKLHYSVKQVYRYKLKAFGKMSDYMSD